ncbi:MAG TPA: DUF4271 domain-containing protein, partial [Bacteroidales bacterium]|nr:DUF4271 domain-containing protein [Bacteroidales bacterium]
LLDLSIYRNCFAKLIAEITREMDLPKYHLKMIPIEYSLPGAQKDTTDTTQKQVLAPQLKSIDVDRMDSLMKLEAQREEQIREQQQPVRSQVIRKHKVEKTDTLLLQYKTIGFYDSALTDNLTSEWVVNPLINIPVAQESVSSQPVFYENNTAKDTYKQTQVAYTIEAKPKQKDYEQSRQDLGAETGGMTFVLLLSMVIVGSLTLFYKRHLQRIIKAIWSFSEAQLLYRERNSPLQRASAQLNFLFHTMIAVFVVQWMAYKGIQVPKLGFWEALTALFVVANAVFVFRFVVSRIIGYLFAHQELFHEFFYHIYLFPKAMGLILFPLTVIIQYTIPSVQSTLFHLSFALVGILYLGQTLRSFRVIIKYNVSILFLILYLCAFEIVPVIWVYKLISLAL